MKINIPNEFIKIAEKYSINENYAAQIFLSKVAKKNTDAVRNSLVSTGICQNESQARKKITEIWAEFKRDTSGSPVDRPNNTGRPQYRNFVEKASIELDKIIGPVRSRPAHDVKYNEKDRVAIISDLHIPFLSKRSIEKIMQDPADKLLICGDYFDQYSASRHRKTVDKYTVSEELAVGKVLMAKLSEKFTEIYMISGNHDISGLKRVGEIYPQLLPLIVDPIDLIIRDFPNVKKIKSVIPNTSSILEGDTDLEVDFFGSYNDCLMAHFSEFCGYDAPRMVDKWLRDWDHILEFERQPRVILQAHTHKLSSEFTPKGRLLVSTGCLCKPMEYQITNHRKYSPPTIGYVAIYQNPKTKITDLSTLEMVFIGE